MHSSVVSAMRELLVSNTLLCLCHSALIDLYGGVSLSPGTSSTSKTPQMSLLII